MKLSNSGKLMIKRYEGLRLSSYKAHASELFLTIGYGHYGADVKENMKITKDEADAIFEHDILKYENAVNALNLPINQNQFDALVSFSFNCGVGNLRRLVNNRTLEQISNAIVLYNKCGGKELVGLTRRRKEEQAMFNKKDILDEIAKEVIDGKWGNGRTRKEKLTSAGYNYADVQRAVNRIMKGK